MNLKKWFKQTIREKVLNIVDGLAGQFKDQQGNPDWRKAVRVFTQFCDNSLELTPNEQEVVNEVIKALKLTDEIDSLRAFWQKIPGPLRDVTKSLENYTEPIIWKVLGQDDKELSYGNLAGPLGSLIGFKAVATLDLLLQSLDGSAANTAIGITCQDDQRVLEIGLSGKLEVSSPGGTLPLGFIGITGSADVTGTAVLDYYYLNKAKWLFIEAVVHDVPHLASPFDAADIAAEQAHRLQAIHLNVAGSLQAALGLSVGKTWGASYKVKSDSLDLDSEVSLGAQVSAGLQADMTLKGTWDVLVKQKGNQVLYVKVQNDRSKDKSKALSLDARLGIGGLDAIGDALIKKYLPDPAGLLDKLNQFSNFGSLLKAEVKKQLDLLLKTGEDDTLKKELVNVIVGEDNAAALAEAIGNAAETALNNQLDLLAGKATNAGQQILQDIAKKLNLPGDLGDKLVKKAEGEMTKLLDNIKGKLEDQLKKIIADNEGKLETLFKPLDSVGKTVTDFSAELDKLSQQLLEPVIHLLTKYQQQRNKIVNVVRDSASLKLELQFSRTLTSSSKKITVLEFEVDTREEKAREYYKEMVAGNYTNALAAARRSKDGSDGIKLTGGSFQDTVTGNLTTDVTFNIFGAQITAKTILDSDVQVRLDTAGNIMVADSTATMDKTFSAFGKTWEVKFINMMELPGCVSKDQGESDGAETAETRLFTSSLSLTYQDIRLKKKELDTYLGSLVETGLVAENILEAIDNRYNELSNQAHAEGKKLGGKIGLSLALTSPDIQKMLNTNDEDIQLIAINNQLKTYLKDTKHREAFNLVLSKWYDRSEDEIEQIKKIAASGKLGDALSRYNISNIDERRDPATVPPMDEHYINIAHHIGKNAANLVEIIQNMRIAAEVRFTEKNMHEEVNKLNQYNKTTDKYLKHWLKIGGILSSLGIKPETIPPVTLAFIATIGELCQLSKDGAPFLTPTAAWSILDRNKPEVFA
jgi:hypothetical protein